MLKLRSVLLNSKAAIDLASIMVGIIVIGLIGGVIAATVFAVIPWAQDNAAKEQLQSIHTAQNAAYGLSADPAQILPEGQERNSFTNSAGLEQQGLLVQGETYCTVNEGTDNYLAYAVSASGVIWASSNTDKTPQPFTDALPQDCEWLKNSDEEPATPPAEPGTDVPEEETGSPAPGAGEQLYTDTRYLLNCTVRATELYLPMREGSGNIKVINKSSQTEVYNAPITFTNVASESLIRVVLEANVNYELVYDGTFASLGSTSGHRDCYREMISWRSDAGTTNATHAFYDLGNLTKVPEKVPSSVISFNSAFMLTNFNGSLSSWDVSNVVSMHKMFEDSRFNQDISMWDVSSVKNMSYMFADNSAFNQPLKDWKVGKVENMERMFFNAIKFNQHIRDWDVSQVKNMSFMFGATLTATDGHNFNQALADWDVSNVTDMNNMFYNTRTFNQPLNGWDVSNVTNMERMFHYSKAFNKPLNEWNTSNVTNMNNLLSSNKVFVQDISMWNVKNVTKYTNATGSTNTKFTAEMRPKFGK